MSIVVILQILTVIISISSIIVNVKLTKSENSIKHFLHYTTKFRINNLLNVRMKMVSLLNCSNPVIIESYSADELKGFLKEIYDSSTEIELIFKKIYSEEQEMMTLIRRLVDLSVRYFTDRDNASLKQSIYGVREELMYLYSIYETSDWEFIKKQTYGRTMDNEEFIETYNKYKQEFENLN